MAKPRYQKHNDTPKREDGEVYGFLLTIRAIAAFAIRWPEYPTTLRVLAVLAEYMNQDGKCRVSRFTLADRLGMSRQAVQHHLKSLRSKEFIMFESDTSATTRFALDYELIDELCSEREGQSEANKKRDARRAERNRARQTKRPPKAQVQALDLAPVHDGAVETVDSPSIVGDEVAGASSGPCTPCKPQTLQGVQTLDLAPGASSGPCTKKPSFMTSSESHEREGAGAPASPCGSPGAAPPSSDSEIGATVFTVRGCGKLIAMADDDVATVEIDGFDFTFPAKEWTPEHVFHAKYGHGTVVYRLEDTVCVYFDSCGEKKVVSSFLVQA